MLSKSSDHVKGAVQHYTTEAVAAGCALNGSGQPCQLAGYHHWQIPLVIHLPTWHFSRPYFLVSRTAVQHDCLALMWRTVLAVQRRHWSPWICGMPNTVRTPLCVRWCGDGGWINAVFNVYAALLAAHVYDRASGNVRRRCVFLIMTHEWTYDSV